MAWTKKIVTATLDKALVKQLDKIVKAKKYDFKSRSALIEAILTANIKRYTA